jgi:hypothetical protein
MPSAARVGDPGPAWVIAEAICVLRRIERVAGDARDRQSCRERGRSERSHTAPSGKPFQHRENAWPFRTSG